MFLRNFYNSMARMYFDTTPTSGEFGEGSLCLKRTNGSIYTSAIQNSHAFSPVPNRVSGDPLSGWSRFMFGGGDTPVTFDDYALASPFNGNVIPEGQGSAIQKSEITYDSETNTYSCTVKLTITNISVNPITIKEIGIANEYILIFRDVLATPITVSSNETIDFTYTFTYTFPEVSS